MPVRPDSFIEISNFYTLTVYEKGSEVVGMIHTLLGAEGFRKGSDLYFERHDGQAVTCDDFIKAMEDANGADLSPVQALVQPGRYAAPGGERVLRCCGQDLQPDLPPELPGNPGQSRKSCRS